LGSPDRLIVRRTSDGRPALYLRVSENFELSLLAIETPVLPDFDIAEAGIVPESSIPPVAGARLAELRLVPSLGQRLQIMQQIKLSLAQKLQLKSLLELHQIIEQRLEKERPEQALIGLEGLQAADRDLKAQHAVGIVIGGM